jgi:hypothetical protein
LLASRSGCCHRIAGRRDLARYDERFPEELRTTLVTKAVRAGGDKIRGIGSGARSFGGAAFMDAGTSPARQPRVKHRHELHTLTYVTLDQANGGIVRNLSHEGVGLQVVAGVRPRQQLRVRFELRDPRLRVDSRGEVMWATRSGQCGIRFLDLSPEVTQWINEWIFDSLLEAAALHGGQTEPIFAGTPFGEAVLAESLTLPAIDEVGDDEDFGDVDDDGLIVSATPLKVIELPVRPKPQAPVFDETMFEEAVETAACDLPRDWSAEEQSQERRSTEGVLLEDRSPELDWLSRPLSGRSLVWTINALVALAALLLVVLVFLSVTGEPPRWPLAMMGGAAVCVAGLYWGFFHVFAGASPGARLARMVGSDYEEDEEFRGARFR